MKVLREGRPSDDHAPLLELLFSINLRELPYPIKEIIGEIPNCVQGTYYLNGPALFARGIPVLPQARRQRYGRCAAVRSCS